MKEKQLDEALQTWPLEEMPFGFSDRVMEQIQARQPTAQILTGARIKFRLTWADYILGFSLSLLPLLGFIAFTFLPRKFILFVSYQWLVLRSPAYEPVLLAMLGVVGMLALLAFFLGLRYIFPRQWALF